MAERGQLISYYCLVCFTCSSLINNTEGETIELLYSSKKSTASLFRRCRLCDLSPSGHYQRTIKKRPCLLNELKSKKNRSWKNSTQNRMKVFNNSLAWVRRSSRNNNVEIYHLRWVTTVSIALPSFITWWINTTTTLVSHKMPNNWLERWLIRLP